MSDLLLHNLPAKPQKRPKTPTPATVASKQNQNQNQKTSATRPLSRIVRGVNNLVLSWRDGLAEPERDDRRRTEERKQILAARMHNVRLPPCSVLYIWLLLT